MRTIEQIDRFELCIRPYASVHHLGRPILLAMSAKKTRKQPWHARFMNRSKDYLTNSLFRLSPYLYINQMIVNSVRLFTLVLLLYIAGCDDGHLRGSVISSSDGKTYLMVMDDNGGQCGPIYVDGKVWEHKIDEEGLIEPGIHTIKCGGEISFEIPKGVIYSFDYWGP